MNTISGELIREARERSGLTQRALAERAGTTQSVVGRIEAGIGSPRVETVEKLLDAAGFRARVALEPIAPEDPVVRAYQRDIDRTLLRDNLRRTPQERVEALQALQRLAAEAQRVGKTRRRRE
jgi:transcriptional regulator with XRE-family HTH domain